MACPAGPLERCAYTTDQEKLMPLPNKQSHCTKERVRDNSVKLAHVVTEVMVMGLFLYGAVIDRKTQIIYVFLIFT